MADVYGQRIKYRQDMPPIGGYADIIWRRTFPKRFWTGVKLLAVWNVITIYGLFTLITRRKQMWRQQVENLDAKCAAQPFFMAERDRNWLRHLRFLRGEENRVMKDVPGWVTGTWYGEPRWFTTGEQWLDPWELEVVSHHYKTDYSPRIQFFRYFDQVYRTPRWYDKYLPEWFQNGDYPALFALP